MAAARSAAAASSDGPGFAAGPDPGRSRELGRAPAPTAPALGDGVPAVAAPASGVGRELGTGGIRLVEDDRPIGEIVAPGDSESPPRGSAIGGLLAAFAPARRAGRASGMIWASPGGG
ncbi:hypothetical protein [Pseudofrankia inefficax]|uniref:hypothetical protein n=1 Tax=Pseudofrankia inefficax (strain DSM 45817 / CECT 9037 / DDB 130130 / EuI1c) TaxID=298654 RepID=UPI00032545C6|nr:hypothetical protein [Pseudofrankia inefficax]